MTRVAFGQNDQFNRALIFATESHGNQVRAGNEHVPYIAHPMEVGILILRFSDLPANLAGRAAVAGVLHDILEETGARKEEIAREFDEEIGAVVQAYTTNKALRGEGYSREAEVRDSIRRIRLLPRHFWVVRLADRFSNLEDFPKHWPREKIAAYLNESTLIAHDLGEPSETLQAMLLAQVAKKRRILSLLV